MNKKLLSFVALLIVLFIGTINFNTPLQKPIISFFNIIKEKYLSTLSYINDTIDEHFFQAETIKDLKEKLLICKEKNIYTINYKQELQSLLNINDANFSINPNVELVRAISYERFGDTNRIWLEIKDYNASKIYGLIYKNYVAGIVISKNSMPLGVLNKDPKSSYAVIIGDVKAPGIVHGNNEENIVATYIPTWYDIKIGDEVITSGLDNIFFKGLKVGKVISITTSQGYKKATLKPYYTSNELNYFYMIKQVR
jgi:rod shape-determining protein MreC